jgi:hypothetical protein
MAQPNLISNGEVIAGKYLSRTGFKFGDDTEYTTAIVHYLSCFDLSTQMGSTTTPTPFHYSNTDVSKGISVISDGTELSKIKFDHAGVYNFIWSGQFENSNSADKDIYVWFRINGEDVLGSTGLSSIPAARGSDSGKSITGWNFFLNLAAGDEVQIMWMKELAAISLAYYTGNANYPSTASVVLTVNQIA